MKKQHIATCLAFIGIMGLVGAAFNSTQTRAAQPTAVPRRYGPYPQPRTPRPVVHIQQPQTPASPQQQSRPPRKMHHRRRATRAK